jgi:hypothetical protein
MTAQQQESGRFHLEKNGRQPFWLDCLQAQTCSDYRRSDVQALVVQLTVVC